MKKVMELAGSINITPNTSLPGTSEIETLIGGFFTVAMYTAGACVALAGICWAWGTHSGNQNLAHRGRQGIIIAFFAAILIGGANFLINQGLGIGSGLG